MIELGEDLFIGDTRDNSEMLTTYKNQEGTHTWDFNNAVFENIKSIRGELDFSELPSYLGSPLVWGVSGHTYSLSWSGTTDRLAFFVDNTNVTDKISDQRLKSDIQNVDNELIQAISECEYKQFRKKNTKDIVSVGIIAQDLAKKLKKYGKKLEDYEILYKSQYKIDEDTLYYKVDYEQFLLLRLMAKENEIKELQEKDKQKDDLLKELTKRIEKLEKAGEMNE